MTHEELVDRSAAKIREILVANLPPDTPLWLFGSRARGDAGFAADFDVMVPFAVDLVLRNRPHGNFADRVLQEARPWN
jgi:predicted nucleotidyltransferase